jgi:hypothetical protein
MNLDPTHSEEIRRLQFLERDAERRYDEAVGRLDNAGAVGAAQEWKGACDALDRFFDRPHAGRAAERVGSSVHAGMQ